MHIKGYIMDNKDALIFAALSFTMGIFLGVGGIGVPLALFYAPQSPTPTVIPEMAEAFQAIVDIEKGQEKRLDDLTESTRMILGVLKDQCPPH